MKFKFQSNYQNKLERYVKDIKHATMVAIRRASLVFFISDFLTQPCQLCAGNELKWRMEKKTCYLDGNVFLNVMYFTWIFEEMFVLSV